MIKLDSKYIIDPPPAKLAINFNEYSPSIIGCIEPGTITQKQIHNEPMLFSTDIDFARNNSGPITNNLLDGLFSFTAFKDIQEEIKYDSESFKDLTWVIDTRCHMLMKGMYPAIPGWHCDDVPRSPASNNQPDLRRINEKVRHICVTLSDYEQGVSNTEYLNQHMAIVVDTTSVWDSVNKAVNEDRYRMSFFAEDGQFILFDQLNLHRASPAIHNGWRYFFRMSLTHRKPSNEIRKQTQVYLTSEHGW